MRRTILNRILFLVVFWMTCAVFIVFYEAAILDFGEIDRGTPYDLTKVLGTVLPLALAGCCAVAALEVLVLGRLFRRRPYGTAIAMKTAFYLCCIAVVTSLAELLATSSQSGLPLLSSFVLGSFLAYVSSARVILTVGYWAACVAFALFVLQVSEKFGQGVLIDFLRGKYHRPREEDRIFMVMDLKSSTAHAERLGHLRYSRLIQDCFYDLTDVVLRFRATVYQYVGDEVVLTWSSTHRRDTANCLRIFFAYKHALDERRTHYEATYGFVPEFKAGLNGGRVTVAEVGEIKKELAYHGDPLITASRIQGKCNELGSQVLLSEELAREIGPVADIDVSRIGRTELRGKREPVILYEAKPRSLPEHRT
jgi:adenylate cyclase